MKNKVLKTIGYIVGITWLFTACALDDEVYGMTMLFINVLCTASPQVYVDTLEERVQAKKAGDKVTANALRRSEKSRPEWTKMQKRTMTTWSKRERSCLQK